MNSPETVNQTQPDADPNRTKREEEIDDQIAEIIGPYRQRHDENMQRVFELFKFFARLKTDQEFASLPAVDDILRAIIVFVHATLEDCLRTFAGKLLQYASETTLDDMPLVGQSPTRPAKFFLGALTPFKGQTIDEIIAQSIDAYLQHTNFNNTDDIAAHLKMLGIDPAKVKGSFPQLDQLLERRHLIVHQADVVSPSIQYGPAFPEAIPVLRTIDATVVLGWIKAVNSFFLDVLMEATRIHWKRRVQQAATEPTKATGQSND